MLKVQNVVLCAASSMLLLLAGCSLVQSSDKNDEANASSVQSANTVYTCEAIEPVTRGIEIETGSSLTEACDRALRECARKQASDGSDACVIKRWYDNQTTAEGLMGNRGWACKVSENLANLKGRSWVRSGATRAEARQNALKYCEVHEAGINCQIDSCFDSDYVTP